MIDKLQLVKRDKLLLTAIPLFYTLMRVYLFKDGSLRFATFSIATLWEAKLLLPFARKYIKPAEPIAQLFPTIFLVIPASLLALIVETVSPSFVTNNPILSLLLLVVMALLFAWSMAKREEDNPDLLKRELDTVDNIWIVLLWGGLLIVLGDIFAKFGQVLVSFFSETNNIVTGSTVQTTLVVPATIVLSVLHWREREGKRRPFSEQLPPFLIAIVLTVLSYFAIPNLWQLPRLWGANVPELIQGWAFTPWTTIILAFTLAVVLRQRRAIPLGIVMVALGAIAGGIGSILLTYPAYILLFEQFVPGVLTVTDGDRTAVTIQISLAFLLFLATGPIVAWWLRPGTRRRQLIIAAVTGAVAATFLYGFLIGPIAVIAAHHPIYGVTTSRAGLGGYDWITQIGEAVNNVLFWAVWPTWVLWLMGAALAGFTGWLTPPSPVAEDDGPLPTLLGPVLAESINIGTILLVSLGLIVFVAIFGLLVPQTEIIFDRAGIVPAQPVGLGITVSALQYLALLIAQAIVLLWWLYQRVLPLVSQLPATTESRVLLAQTSVTAWVFGGVLIAIGIMVASAFNQIAFLLAVVLAVIAIGIETIFAATFLNSRFKATIGPVVPPEPTVTHWLGIGLVWSVFVTAILYQFMIMALGLVLIAVALISDLEIPANPPIGMTVLTDLIANAFTYMQIIFALFVLVFGLMQITFKDPMLAIADYLRELSETDEEIVLSVRRSWLARTPFLQRPYYWLEAKIVQLLQAERLALFLLISGFTALFVTTNPVVPLAFLAASMLMWPKGFYLDRLPASLFTLAFLLTLAGIFLAGFPDTPMAAAIWENIFVRLIFGAAGAVVVRAFRLYQPVLILRRTLRLLLLITAVFLIIPYTVNAQSSLQVRGEVARFDGENWQTLPELSGPIGYDFFQDGQGQLWLTSGAGTIVTEVDGAWRRYAPFGTTTGDEAIGPLDADDTDEQRMAKLEQEMLVVEDQQGHLWLALGREFGRFNATYYTAKDESSLLTLSRAGGAESLEEFDSPITDMIVDDMGTLWLATDGSGLTRVDTSQPMDEADWQTYTTANSDIPTDRIFALLYSEEQLWLGTDIGVFHFDNTTWQQISDFDGMTLPVTNLMLDGRENIWTFNKTVAARWQDSSWNSLSFSNSEDIQIETHYVDSKGNIWLGFNMYPPGISRPPMITEGGFLYQVSAKAIVETPSSIWFAGADGLQKFDYGSNEFSPPILSDPIRDLHALQDQNLLVSSFNTQQTTQTAGWSLFIAGIMLVGLYGSTIYGYQRAPETRARRLERRLGQKPEILYPTVYNLLAQEKDAPLVLAELIGYLEAHDPAGAQALRVLANGNRPVADEKPEGFFVTDEREWSRELSALYGLLEAAERANRISAIVALELAVNPGTQPGEFYLTWRDGQTPPLPPFLPDGTQAGWQALERVAVVLRKYEEVDAATDRLSYLAQALTTVEMAQTAVAQIGLPEGPLMQKIADNWRTAITNEISSISGRAELRMELRTRQLRRAEQVTVAWRLQNVGRAAAEDVTLTLWQDDGELGRKVLARLPSGRAEMVEFTLTPPDAHSMRLRCRVKWDDLTAVVQTLDFADVVRFYETAEEFTTIPNPYIVGHPVKGSEMFHGRQDAFRFIAQNLEGMADRTLVLHGQRRTGKTSILYQLLNGRLGANFLPVLIDMQELAPIIENTADFLGEMAYQLARTAQKAGIEIDEPEIEAFEKAAVRTFNRFLDRLEDSLGERRIVVMFDEFELIEGKIAEGKLSAELLGYFRSLMQHRQGLVFIFTGTHRLEEMSHDYWSILFNIALYRRVSFLSRADAVRLIREPVAGKLDVDELAVEKIISLTRGHAYFTQLVCWALVNHCNNQQQNYATINDVNDAVSEIVRAGEAHFAFVWQQASGEERLALAALAHTLRPGKAWARPAELLETLQQAGENRFDRESLIPILEGLTLQEVLESASERILRYRFQLEILQLWIAATHSLVVLVEKESR